jgi:hypothetical protein
LEVETDLDDEDYEGLEDFDDVDDDLLDEFLEQTEVHPLAAGQQTHQAGEGGGKTCESDESEDAN